jgi:hypothetical protein
MIRRMHHLLRSKLGQFRRNVNACEDWAKTLNYPDVRRALLDLAKQWRDMADRFERIDLTLPLDDLP